jgi:exopolyphosphatase/guanosine-5'-triphosphate,3'-diphosphate pyrophosphatase
MLLGALDLGSNSFHLLVARVDRFGGIQKLAGRKIAIRLQDAVASSGRIPPETFATALAAVGDLVEEARRRGAPSVLAAGTSALRDAENGADFVATAGLVHGLEIEILTGEEEGRLVYAGARHRGGVLPERVGVIDLGGGSAEVAIGEGAECSFAASLPLGFLRLARTLDVHGALGEAELTRVIEHVRRSVTSLRDTVNALAPSAWLLSGGTARALGAVLGSEPGAALSTRALLRQAAGFSRLGPESLMGLGVEAPRARGFGLGLLVIAALADELGAPAVRITPGGLREGLLLREIGGRSKRHARVHLHDAGRLARPPA